MRRAALLLAMLALVLPLKGADCQNGAGRFHFTVSGPELPSNLWQFASVRGWQAAASTVAYTGGFNHGRLYWDGTQYGVADSPCDFGLSTPDGSTLVVVAEYTAEANLVTQRAYVAAASFAATNPAPAISMTTMREVPPAVAVNNAGAIQVSWAPLPSQAEIVGYRLVRSSDGLASWTTVSDNASGASSATDTQTTGTYYYAIQVIYLNDTTHKQVSPHGASWRVVVE